MKENKEKEKNNQKLKKDQLSKEKSFLSHYARFILEQKISFLSVLDCLKRNFKVTVLQNEGIKTIIIEEKEEI